MESVKLTRVFLVNVPLVNDYKHTYNFLTSNNQLTYFMTRSIRKEITDFSYQRKEGVMRIPLGFDDAVKYNYVMYQNTSDSNKWYFAFITNYEYKGDDQTNITLETDVMQTYMFDYELLPSFVEREHVDDDTVGLHTVPEGLEVGEFVCCNRGQVEELQKCDIVVGSTLAVTVNSDGKEVMEDAWGVKYNGIYSGIAYYTCDGTKINMLNQWLEKFSEEGRADALKCMFLVPEFMTSGVQNDISVLAIPNKESATVMSYSIQKSDYQRTSYVPKNNKLNCYPYKYLLVSNNNGGSAIYQYENFSNATMEFSIAGAITPGCSIRMTPKDYKGVAINDEEGLNLGKYPICNWTSDEYTNWLTQNSVNIGLSVASGVGQIVVGGAIAIGGASFTGGMSGVVGASTIAGGVATITNTLAQKHQMSFTPPQSQGNINCGDVITSTKNNTYFFYGMTAKDEYLRIIDEYFSMFGYKCNRVKVPNKNHRNDWWFTKTIDVNIKNNGVPLPDMKKIKACYDNGITFWNQWMEIGDYYDGTGKLIDNEITK